jgi:hypothetical protein
VFAGFFAVFVGGWIALSVIERTVGLPSPMVAIPILVFATLFSIGLVIKNSGPREPDPAEVRWAAEAELRRAEGIVERYHAAPAPPPALTATTARRAFWKYAAITLAIWFVPLAAAAVTESAVPLLFVPLAIVVVLYGVSVGAIVLLVARGAWSVVWYGSPPPMPRSLVRLSLVLAFAVGAAAFFAAPGLFAGPMGLLTFLALPIGLAILTAARRKPPQAPSDESPHGVGP